MWLLHWMCFIIFKAPKELFEHQLIAKTIDIFMSEKYLALISLQCPYMLRYAAAAFILHKRLKNMAKDLVHVLVQDRENYKDPLTEFLVSLYQEMDFEKAQSYLT